MKMQVILEGDRETILRESVNLEKAISYLIPALGEDSEMSIKPASNGENTILLDIM